MRKKQEVKPSPIEASDYQVFSEVDLNQKNQVGSYMPAWAYDTLISDLKDDITKGEITLKSSNISQERMSELRDSIEKKKERLYQILDNKPKMDTDKVNSISSSIGEKVADSMFSYTEMQKGTVNAHEEARRMSEPCIKLDPNEANFALACNIPVGKDRQISRNQAAKMWKIARKYLGENSNVETLRRG